MSFEVIPFDPAHLDLLDVQDAQRLPAEEQRKALAAPFGWAWTCMADGVPVVCAGMVEIWENRAYAWALLSRHAGPWMAAITRATRRGLKIAPFQRIEMAVDAGFPAARRWALMLGFHLETPEPMQRYMPNGRAAYLYAMVR